MTETDPCFKAKGLGSKPDAKICKDLGAIGCWDTSCMLMGNASSDEAHCMSGPETTTATTTTTTTKGKATTTTKKAEPCIPKTETDPCFKAQGPGTKPKPNAQICQNLGAIGCGGSNCIVKRPWFFKAP